MERHIQEIYFEAFEGNLADAECCMELGNSAILITSTKAMKDNHFHMSLTKLFRMLSNGEAEAEEVCGLNRLIFKHR